MRSMRRRAHPVEEFGAHGIVNLETPEVMRGYPACTTASPRLPWSIKGLVITGSHLD